MGLREYFERKGCQKRCFHHDKGGNPANSKPAISYIKEKIVDWRKLYECDESMGGCGKRWLM